MIRPGLKTGFKRVGAFYSKSLELIKNINVINRQESGEKWKTTTHSINLGVAWILKLQAFMPQL